MIFTKDLLLKGLAGLALCTGTAALGVHYMGGFSSSSSVVKVTEKDLGLPAGCTFPAVGATGPTSCTLTTDNIGTIEFDGKNSTTITGSSGTQSATLQISKDEDFPHGYLFTVSIPTSNTNGTLTINRNAGNIVVNSTSSVDFKIKQNAGKTFSLEKAWTAEDLAKKLRLNREEDGRWTLGTNAIKVKYEAGSAESRTASPAQEGVTQGKIKAYVETAGSTYNKDIKFVIEDGDIALTGDGTTITKLEQFETYEIKEESGSWNLIRKSKASDEIKKALGLPTECSMPEGSDAVECSLGTAEKLKAIKFEGKSDGDVTVDNSEYSTIKLKISKTTETNREKFPHGFKFVLETEKNITLPGATQQFIKKGTNTEFKIKKAENSNALTLEKAWTVADLAKKVKLTNCTPEDQTTKQCDFGDSINVYDSASSKVTGATLAEGSRGKKLTYQLDQEGHNQGIKFYIPHSEDADITISGGTTTGTAITTISKETSEGAGPTYEIKEEGGVWYLAKKTTAGG